MGLFDDLLEEDNIQTTPKRNGLFDDLLEEDDLTSNQHPVVDDYFTPRQIATDKSEKDKSFFGVLDTASAIGEAASDLITGVPAAMRRAKVGLIRPDQYSPEDVIAFEAERKRNEQLEIERQKRISAGEETSVGSAIREAGRSLGFTAANILPAMAGGAAAGAIAGAAFPAAEVATIPIGVIASGIGAAAGSAPVAYRMAGAQFLDDAFNQLESNSLKKNNRPLTEEEKDAAYKELLPIAQNTGIWEAGPEAVGNAVTLGVGKFVFGFGKEVATGIASNAIKSATKTIGKKVIEKGAAIAGDLAVELGGETITQTQQGYDDAKAQQYIKTGSTAGAVDEYKGLAGLGKAFKEIAPATIATMGLMGAVAGGAKLASKPFSNKTETGEEEKNNNAENTAIGGAIITDNLNRNNSPETARAIQDLAANELSDQLESDFASQQAAAAAQQQQKNATKEIIKPEGVREEPQNGTETQPTNETIARHRVFNPEGSKEKEQIESGVKLKDAWYNREINNLSSLSGLSNQSVHSAMLPGIQNSEVLKSIVTFIPVDVMNDLRVRNIPADELLNNPDMLRDTLSSDSNNDIFRGVVGALGSGVAGLRTELLGRLGRNDLEGAAALIAGFKNPSSLASFLAQDDIPKFTSSVPAEFTNALSRAASSGLLPVGSDAENISTNFARLFDLTEHSAKLKTKFKEKSISNRIQKTKSEEERQIARDIVSELQAVSNNTATNEQIARLSMDGLVDVRRGQAIINEDGEGILAQAQAPLPKLTPEARAAEVEAVTAPELMQNGVIRTPLKGITGSQQEIEDKTLFKNQILSLPDGSVIVTDPDVTGLARQVRVSKIGNEVWLEDAKTEQLIWKPGLNEGAILDMKGGVIKAPAITNTVSEQPIIGEKPQVSPIVGDQVTDTTPVEQVAETQIAEEPIISEKQQTSEIVGTETAAPEVSAIKPQVQVTNIDSLIDQGGGTVAVQEDGRDVKFKQFGIGIDGNTAEIAFVELDPSEQGKGIGIEAYRSLGSELAARGIILRSSGAQYGPGHNLWLKLAKEGLAKRVGQRYQFVAPAEPTVNQQLTVPPTQAAPIEKLKSTSPESQLYIDWINEQIELGAKIYQGTPNERALTLDDVVKVSQLKTGAIPNTTENSLKYGGLGIGNQISKLIQSDSRLQGRNNFEIKNQIETGLYSGRGIEISAIEPVATIAPEPVTAPVAEPSQTGITRPAIAAEEQVVTELEAAPAEVPAPEVAPKAIKDYATGDVNTPFYFENDSWNVDESRLKSGDEVIETSDGPAVYSRANDGKVTAIGVNANGRQVYIGESSNSFMPSDYSNVPVSEMFSALKGSRTYESDRAGDLFPVIDQKTAEKLISKYPPTNPAPAVSETITEPAAQPTPATQPEGIAVGNRIKLGKSPQTYTIEEVIPQTTTERDLGEQYYSVKNERTGEVQVVEAMDLKKVGGKRARKMTASTPQQTLWSIPQQEISSAATSINQSKMPATFKNVKWESGTRNADIGGGRFDNATEYLAGLGTENVIYDPYNRSQESNQIAVSKISGGQSDTATINNVLNVIAEPESRDLVIRQAADAIKPDGKAYFLIYEGSSKGVGSQTKFGWQENRKAETYIAEIKNHFGNVTRKGNLIIAENPVKTKEPLRQAAEFKNEEIVTPIPEANRYTYEEAVRLVDSYFDKEGIPEGIVIVNNTTDPDLEMKAGYFVDRGQIVINLAYIAKGESLSDIISHELGHFIFSDPQFQADFKAFWDLMTPEEQADADRIINQFYNKETGAIQMEEKQVRAFMQLIQDSKAMPKWRQILDSIKRWINKYLKTNFQVTDRNALAVLAAAHKRFKSGERIIREIDSGVLKTADTAQDAEYLAAVERGDMETAQRMVDEAARKAGYNSPMVYHGSSDKPFNIFKTKRGKKGTREGGAFFTPTETLANYFAEISQQVKYGGITDKPGIIYKAYLKMDNPVVIDQKFENVGSIEDKNINRIKAAKKYGFDGIIWKNTIEPFHPDGVDQYIVFSSEQIKSSDPVTRDDQGNVIPLSQRFRTTSQDIRRMAAEPRREQVAGMERGDIITTPEGIIKQTNEVLRNKFFDGSEVSDEATLNAWNYIEQMLDIKSGAANALAGQINDVADQETNSDTRMGASLFSVSLANYAAKLAAQGDTTMISYLIRRINRMPIDNLAGGISKAAEAMRAKREYNIDGFNTLKTEGKSKVERTAAALFGTDKPGEDQVKAVDDAIKASEDTPIGEPEEVSAEIEKVENRTGRKVIKAIDDKIKENIEGRKNLALEKQKSRPRTPYGVEGQAQSIINQFSTLLSDVPTFTEKQENRIRTIVQQDLRQRPDMKRKQPWTSQLTAKLIDAGVDEAQAQIISDLVWRQHEIKTMDRELKEFQTAAEKGSLTVIIQRIKDTPIEQQQKPGWMQGVIREYLIGSGLSSKAADTAARLYESVISERLAEAKQKAFNETLSKSAPWNNYLSRNSRLGKDALKKIQDAIRTGVLDPTQNVESIIAKENGWSGFSKEQLQRIVQLDNVISNPDTDEVTKAESMHELNSIIVKAKMPVRFKDAIGAYYVGQALMGIPTLTVNIASPIGFSVRNLISDIGRYSFTEPSRIPMAFETFLDSMKSWYNQTSYAFKNQIYLNDVVEYLNGQNVLRELFDKGKAQWAKGEYASGMVNMLVGMTQITGRVLASLDQGAISMLENQNISRYAMEAMKQKNIPQARRKEIANMILDTRRRTYAESIAAGMEKDRSGVLADMAVRTEIAEALAPEGINFKNVLDSAINDSLQAVGRNKTIDTKGIVEESKRLSDAGMLSYLPIEFLQKIASGAANSGPLMQVFSKMLYGFALVPARVFHTTAWYSPYGFIRLGIDKYKKNKGEESPYAMSLQTDLQYKQRLTDAIAGSIVMLGLAALASGSADDDDDKKFKIVITGNGPSYTADRQYFDSWNKKWKPYSIHIVMGDTIIPINIGRGGEALFFPIMLAGALDDWGIKKKLNLTKKTPEDLNFAVEALGSAFFALAQRGPYAAFTRPLFDASKEGKITEELVGQAGFFGKTFVPILGASVARNISDFINDPVDRSSLEGAIYANTPVIGPWMGTKALNALGQPIRADDWGDKLYKLGVPVAFSFPKNTPENELNELILKKGGGPSIPTRSNAQKRLGDVMTDKEFETYVREYGRVVSDKMFKNRKKLENMSVKNYDDELQKYVTGYSIDGIKVTGASDMAVRAVKRSRNQ
jgi:hypothetical protein